MSGMITPTRNGQPITPNYGVQVPTQMIQQNIPQAGMQQQQQGQMYNPAMQQQNAAFSLINMFGQQGAAGNGGINWGEVESQQVMMDPILQSLQATEAPKDNWKQFINSGLQYIQVYLSQYMNSNGPMYDCITSSITNFQIDQTGNKGVTREVFTKKILTNQSFRNKVVQVAGIMFGARIIDGHVAGLMKDNTYPLSSIESVIRNTMMMELISWMNITTEGQNLAYNIPADIQNVLNNLEGIKAVYHDGYKYFGIPSPYDGLTFKIKTYTSGLPAHLTMSSDYTAEAAFNGYEQHNNQPIQGLNELQLAQREVERQYRSGQSPNQVAHTYQRSEMIVDPYTRENAFGNVRNDVINVTKDNIAQFNLRDYFRAADAANHKYVILEENWKYFRRAIRKDAVGIGPAEITVLNDSYSRLVTLDLDNLDKGWKSTAVKHAGYTAMQIFTDPERILPILQANEDRVVTVTMKHLKSISDLKSLTEEEGPIYNINETVSEDQVTTIKLDDKVVSNDSRKFEELVAWTGGKVIAEHKEFAATGVTGVITNSFTVIDANVKKKLTESVPQLFKETKAWEYMSWLDCVQEVHRNLANSYHDEELKSFVEWKLTGDLNAWLINVGGYPATFDTPGHLSCTNIFTDLREMMECIKQGSPDCFDALTKVGGCNLVAALAVFTTEEPDLEGESEIVKEHAKTEIPMMSEINFVVFNQLPDFGEQTPGEPTIIYRSNVPGVFSAIEKLYPGAGGITNRIPTMVFCRTTGRHLVFNLCVHDTNVGFLRELASGCEYTIPTYKP